MTQGRVLVASAVAMLAATSLLVLKVLCKSL